jgi:hypothetical protein
METDMRKHVWIITKDCLAEPGERNETGTSGPHDMGLDVESRFDVEPFRLYDDDGVLYYEGLIAGDYEGFEPLQDFGMPNAGATSIHYRNLATGEWEPL